MGSGSLYDHFLVLLSPIGWLLWLLLLRSGINGMWIKWPDNHPGLKLCSDNFIPIKKSLNSENLSLSSVTFCNPSFTSPDSSQRGKDCQTCAHNEVRIFQILDGIAGVLQTDLRSKPPIVRSVAFRMIPKFLVAIFICLKFRRDHVIAETGR
jgi:hypothetical protein